MAVTCQTVEKSKGVNIYAQLCKPHFESVSCWWVHGWLNYHKDSRYLISKDLLIEVPSLCCHIGLVRDQIWMKMCSSICNILKDLYMLHSVFPHLQNSVLHKLRCWCVCVCGLTPASWLPASISCVWWCCWEGGVVGVTVLWATSELSSLLP